jgi:uncharacterized damage-inducible protein DinB
VSLLGERLVEETIRRFEEEYLPRLEAAVALLPPDRLWWRPHEDVPSVGNLLLHLEGNVRQWLLGGLGGGPTARARKQEFSARGGADSGTLLADLRATVTASFPVLRSLDEEALLRDTSIQGFPVTGLDAVLHVQEHFGWHTGQIVWIAKSVAGPGHGLAFHDDDALEGH